jgi:hypothetical protein
MVLTTEMAVRPDAVINRVHMMKIITKLAFAAIRIIFIQYHESQMLLVYFGILINDRRSQPSYEATGWIVRLQHSTLWDDTNQMGIRQGYCLH